MKSSFIKCEKCGKTLMERLPNGLFRFLFGKAPVTGAPIVNMMISGSIKMLCIRKSCKHPNILHFFPFKDQSPEGMRIESELEKSPTD